MKDDRLYLLHILECIRRVEAYSQEGRERFYDSEMAQDAILRNLQILSESTQRLSDVTKQRRPDVEWSAISGFRNVLTHNYLGVDLEQVWSILQRDVPVLKGAVSSMLEELE